MKTETTIISMTMLAAAAFAAEPWTIDTQKEWVANAATQSNLEIKDGMATPTQKSATFKSHMKVFKTKRSAASLTIDQSPVWENWKGVPNLGPSNLSDAPVMLSLGPDNYWMFGRYGGGGAKRPKKGAKPAKQPAFVVEDATLEGFNIPLKTTKFPNQYDAPGGLMPKLGGYHAWQSKDMVNWVHHGAVTEGFSRWTTTAEFNDGKVYIYYDFPNDQDPHVYVDDDLFDGKPGKNMGMAFKDPSHGSDCAVIRDLDGVFHVIAEDWSPIDASKNAWDSPLAVHAVSDDGTTFDKILAPPVDHRTKPTGRVGTYKHPHWAKEDPKNYPTDEAKFTAKYEIHEPAQNAYGDWAAISVGGQFYLFCDFDPAAAHSMSTGRFTAPTIDGPFEWCGHVGKGHPDPDVMFAEGQFYLATQQNSDFVSPGPWVESVEARVGVDTNRDGSVDQWTKWQTIKESYDHIPGFSKQVAKTPAALELGGLPAGYGFQVEVKLTDTTENESKPVLDKITLSFK